jgi:hypothetical protein
MVKSQHKKPWLCAGIFLGVSMTPPPVYVVGETAFVSRNKENAMGRIFCGSWRFSRFKYGEAAVNHEGRGKHCRNVVLKSVGLPNVPGFLTE